MELGLSAVAVVVQIADNFAFVFCDQELSVVVVRAAGDALGQRGDRICLLDDYSRERGADDVVVYRRESHPADGRDRWRVGHGGRSNHQPR